MTDDTQTENLTMVKRTIGAIVLAFLWDRWRFWDRWRSSEVQFHIRDLHHWVRREARVSPASADRILRQLRLDGKCDYHVVNRHKSLYTLTWIVGCGKPRPVEPGTES